MNKNDQTKKSIAIVGGGVVGATAAFYLAEAGYPVTIFDDGVGQATSAAAGIICPWLSKRRNKKWYRLASGGAAFYAQLISDLEEKDGDSSFYTRSGAVLLNKNSKTVEEQCERGLERRKEAPEIGKLKILNKELLHALFPTLQNQENGLYVEGGARVDGSKLVYSLLKKVKENNGKIYKDKIQLVKNKEIYSVKKSDGSKENFEIIILATGAWLPQILEPLGWNVDVRGQKGQLAVLQTNDKENGTLPVLIPEGEIDILPIGNGTYYVGASHENEQGYDLNPDKEIIGQLIQNGKKILGSLENSTLIDKKVGTRAYTSDFSPFFGYLPHSSSVLVASGLGSSGLTTGPYIGYLIASLIKEKDLETTLEDYSPNPYLQIRTEREEF